MNATALQTALLTKGYNPGPVDGQIGRRTYAALFSYMAGRDLGERGDLLGLAAARRFPDYGITTPLRLAHFLAQAYAETGAFRFMREIWGPTAAQKRYEGRADLGNTQPGDGHRFLGRGIFQITGRDNYVRYGAKIGADLTTDPQIAEEPEVAVWLACIYWSEHHLNEYADADNILGTSNGINRGNPASIREPNGFAERKKGLARAKAVLC